MSFWKMVAAVVVGGLILRDIVVNGLGMTVIGVGIGLLAFVIMAIARAIKAPATQAELNVREASRQSGEKLGRALGRAFFRAKN